MNDEDRIAKLIKYELFRTIPGYRLTGLSGQAFSNSCKIQITDPVAETANHQYASG